MQRHRQVVDAVLHITLVFETELDLGNLVFGIAGKRVDLAVQIKLDALFRFAGAHKPESSGAKRQQRPQTAGNRSPALDHVKRRCKKHGAASGRPPWNYQSLPQVFNNTTGAKQIAAAFGRLEMAGKRGDAVRRLEFSGDERRAASSRGSCRMEKNAMKTRLLFAGMLLVASLALGGVHAVAANPGKPVSAKKFDALANAALAAMKKRAAELK